MKPATSPKFHYLLAAALGATLALPGSAAAAGDAERGKAKSAECQACHGADGNSPNAAFPKIAGQHANYIAHALKAYATGERQNPIMQGFAAKLTAQDRADLGAYFASQNGLSTPSP